MDCKEAHAQFDAIVGSLGITIECVYLKEGREDHRRDAERARKSRKPGEVMRRDLARADYKVRLRKAQTVGTRDFAHVLEFEYSAGSEIVRSWYAEQGSKLVLSRYGQGQGVPDVYDLGSIVRDLRKGYIHRPTADHIQVLRWIGEKYYRPTLADVLSSLILDTNSFDATWSFREWAEDYESKFGPFEGSPADALDMFEAIQRSNAFLTRAIQCDILARLRELSGEL